MDGVETTAKIREMGGMWETLPIIALTANAIHGAKEMFLAHGFNDFISKPIDTGELVRVLQDWLPLGKIKAKAESEDPQARLTKEDELIRKATLTFAKENERTFETMAASLNSGDIATAHRIAHTLKSGAGYLGKKQLQEAAFSLEQSLQAQPPGYTPEQLDTLGRELEKALREFEPLVKAAAAEKPDAVQIDNDTLTALLSEIRPLLEKGDFGATEYVGQLQGAAGMEELAEKIDDYDFEGALALLNSL